MMNRNLLPMPEFTQRLLDSFSLYKKRNAIYINDSYITYAELKTRVFGIANDMVTNNRKGGVVAIFGDHDLDTYACVLASWICAMGFVPLNAKLPEDRIKEIGDRTQTGLVYHKGQKDKLKVFNKLKLVDTALIDPANELNFDLQKHPAGLAYVLFTSGSSGQPKPVPITLYNLTAFIDSFENSGIGIDENDRVLHMADFSFDMSMLTFLIPLLNGACVYPLPGEGMKYLQTYEMLEKHKITFTALVPSLLRFLSPYFYEIKLDNLKNTLVCGEEFPVLLAEEWKNCAPNSEIFNIYGPTEATVFVCYHKWQGPLPEHEFNGIMSIGKAVNNAELLIVDDDLTPLPAGCKGELCIHGPQVMNDYLDDPDIGKKSFVDIKSKEIVKRFYRTGDIAVQPENGCYFFCGRKDNQVKVSGHRVSLEEIEQRIKQHFPTIECCAVPITDPLGNTAVYLCVEKNPKLISQVRNKMANFLAPYQMPSKIVNVNSLPIGSNGKIDRKILVQAVNSR